jgi:hypothetical protein
MTVSFGYELNVRLFVQGFCFTPIRRRLQLSEDAIGRVAVQRELREFRTPQPHE